MGVAKIVKKGADLYKGLPSEIKDEIKNALQEGADALKEEAAKIAKESEKYRKKYAEMPKEQLAVFVPTIYQKTIFDIDYDLLKEKGKKLISFDIDDTIIALENRLIPKFSAEDAIALFESIKEKGFKTVIITNAKNERAEKLGEILGVDGWISRAKKPESASFEKLMRDFGEGLTKEEAVHVGNSMRTDIQGANNFGISSCLVRNLGIATRIGRSIMKSEGHYIRAELRSRGMWRKHHKDEKKDQYYQLGEKQHGSANFPY